MMPSKSSARIELKLVRAAELTLTIALLLLGPATGVAQQNTSPKRILVLYWYSREWPSNVMFQESFQTALQSAPHETIEYYDEYLDSNRFPDDDQQAALHQYLKQKYARHNIDVIVAVADAPLSFLLKYRADLFPNTPIVFTAVKPPSATEREAGAGLTGVVYAFDYRNTLELALRLHQGTEQVFVVSGTLERDKRYESMARESLHGYENRVSITYLTDLSPDELTSRIKSLPQHSIVLYAWQQAYDGNGKLLETRDILDLVVKSSRVPVYGLASWQVGNGTVGGYVRTIESSGTRAAELALRIANGERAQDLGVQTTPTIPMFDWRQLERWGIGETVLPPGSIVRFREPSFWDQYKWYAISVLSILLIQSGLIAGLVLTRARRKRAEAEREIARADVYESQARLAGIIDSAMDAIISIDQNQHIVLFNDSAEKMFGCAESEVIGQTLDRFIPEQLREAHSRHITVFGNSNVQTIAMGDRGAIRGRRTNGEEFPIEASISQIELKGTKFYTVILRDVTQRYQAEEALRDLQESLTIALEASQMGTWDLDLTRDLSGHRNLRHDQIFGYDEPQTVWGREVARRHIVEDDLDVFDEAFARAMQTGELEFEARVRWPSGAIHWMAARGHFYFDKTGKPTRGAGVNFDITERKRAEEAVRESEERFRNMADTAPVLIWVSDAENLCTYVNQQWLNFTGRTIEQELGDAWTTGIHPDDLVLSRQVYKEAFERREPFTFEYRLRRADGEYRVVHDSGVPRFSANGEFLGYIGSCIDVTDNKRAEQALRESYNRIEDLAGRLIVAQEDERKRIARDLHDDLHQQVAALAISLDMLEHQLSESDAPIREQVVRLQEATATLSTWIRRLSHELHSSVLQHLGLAEALKMHCSTFTQQQGIEVKLDLNGVGPLPPDVALCLDRVAQEALRNIARHSGAKSVELSVAMNNGGIELRIADHGKGFHVEEKRGGGLGLISMEERAKLLGGKFEIKSEPGVGTELKVSLPLGQDYGHA